MTVGDEGAVPQELIDALAKKGITDVQPHNWKPGMEVQNNADMLMQNDWIDLQNRLDTYTCIEQGMVTIYALMTYEYNVAHEIIVREIYGSNHSSGYLEEKESLLGRRGILFLNGLLDRAHKGTLAPMALHRYGAEAMRALEYDETLGVQQKDEQ